MPRNAWLIASLIALFGLQGPLCMIDCRMDFSVASPVADGSGEMPCHGSGDSASDSESGSIPDSPPAGHDCDCLASAEPVVVKTVASLQGLTPVLTLPTLRLVAYTGGRESVAFRTERVPRPHVLLLTSILLI